MGHRILRYLTCFLVAASTTNAFAGIRTSIVGAATSTTMNASNVPSTATVSGVTITNLTVSGKSKIGYGAGVLFDASLASVMSVEFGLLFVNRKSESTSSFSVLGVPQTDTSTDSLNYIELPVILRAWLTPMFSLGAGGYYAQGIGSKFSGSGVTKNDYGAIGSAQLRLPMGGSAFLLDGRYNYGFKNVNASSVALDLKYREIELLVGVTFGGGK